MNTRLPIKRRHDLKAMNDLAGELTRRFVKHGTGAYASPHEALGIITEEMWELVEAVKLNDRSATRGELLDVAVAALVAVMSQDAHVEWDKQLERKRRREAADE
jgi:NTP pyrophosphatase (non-canonical NTP hydrolase)